MVKFKELQRILPGFILAIVVGCAAFYIAGRYRILDPLVIGIVLGMIVRFIMGKRELLEKGLGFASKLFITIGIMIYGVNLKFHKLDIIPAAIWIHILIGIAIVFWVCAISGKRLSISNKTSMLIGVGTAICGASAIALTTPIIKGKSEDTGVSLLTITLWGLVGMAIYPFLQRWLLMSSDNYALICATTLHQTGLVKVAAGMVSAKCIETAMIIKMARTCMIIPIMGILSWSTGRSRETPDVNSKMPIPWFLWVFVAVGLAFSFVPFLRPYVKQIKPLATILWTMAMTGLGLSIDFQRIVFKMGKPLLVGLLAWLAVVAFFFVGYYAMGH